MYNLGEKSEQEGLSPGAHSMFKQTTPMPSKIQITFQRDGLCQGTPRDSAPSC